MRSRLLALWRSLPAPVRRSAHLTVGAPGAALRASGEAWDAAAENVQRHLEWRRVIRTARRRNLAPTTPVTIAGFHGAVHGLGEGARMLARGFADIGEPTRAIDLSAEVGFPVTLSATFPSPGADEAAGVLISHINPPELMRWARATGGQPLARRHHIGYWAWELEEAPAEWAPAFDLVDEVWCPSAFAATAVRAMAPARVKVTAVPYPVYLNPRPAPDRARFGLAEDRVVVLMAFDLRSTAQRKNPYAALRAFRQAVKQASRPALLLCKVVGADLYPETFSELQALVAGDPGIRLMTDSLSARDMAVLTASSDIVLSLHRSEGFGLLLAEAIWLGKPTLATGWSSNVEFMDPASSLLVDYALVPVEGDGAIYRAGRWAAADEADAARKLARLIQDDDLRATLAAATTRNGHVAFDREAWTRMIRAQLPLA